MTKNITATVTPFETYEGQDIFKYTLTNGHGVSLSTLNYGALIYEILVPTKIGGTDNLVLNFPKASDYAQSPTYLCMAVGRTAGRISQGKVIIDGKTVQLPTNEGTTTLHGGPHGFSKAVWSGSIIAQDGQPAITFHRLQQGIVDGYPGDLDVSLTYTLNADDTITITFAGTATETSLFNPTVHTYFNLGAKDDIFDHDLKVNASQHLELDAVNAPTGKLLDNANTAFDFQNGANLGQAIDALKDTPHQGLDDLFKVTPDTTIATLSDPTNGRSVDVSSDRNGLVVYTANTMNPAEKFIKTNGVGKPYLGVALEAQNLPDTTKNPQFGDETIPADETVTHTISYHLNY
ncbi:MAG: galactose mutarotase [Lactobacillus sp.]|nr:galactose mutarotase [Lactobacillus sp.]